MHPIEIHRRAVKVANAAVADPNFKVGTPEHEAWLKAFDAEVKRIAKEEK